MSLRSGGEINLFHPPVRLPAAVFHIPSIWISKMDSTVRSVLPPRANPPPYLWLSRFIIIGSPLKTQGPFSPTIDNTGGNRTDSV